MRRLLPFVCVVVVVDTALYSALTPPELREAVGRVGRALEEVATTGRGK